MTGLKIIDEINKPVHISYRDGDELTPMIILMVDCPIEWCQDYNVPRLCFYQTGSA